MHVNSPIINDESTGGKYVDDLSIVLSHARFQLTDDSAKPPLRNNSVNHNLASDNVGIDLFVSGVDNIVYDQDNIPVRCRVRTGVIMAVPPGFSIILAPRSSLAKSGWYIANTIGIIDNPYRGELLVMLARLPDWGVQRVAKNVSVKAADDSIITVVSMEVAKDEYGNDLIRKPIVPDTGDRTAQAIIVKDYILPLIESKGDLGSEQTGRGKKGFGSSGK